MSRILLISPIIFSISNTFGAILITFKHYLSYAFSAGFYNIGIIAGLVLFHDRFGIYSAAIGVVIGLFFHLILRMFDMAFVDFQMKFKLFSPGLLRVFKLSLPKTFGLLFTQIGLWAFNIIGYGLVAGSIAAFNYARNIQSFAVSLFGISIATAVFPFLVDFKEENKSVELIDKIESTFIQIFLFTIPAAIGLSLLDSELVTILFGRGAFDSMAGLLTSTTLFWFAFSIPFESVSHLLARVYYAFSNTIIPVLVNLLFLTINLVGSYFFSQAFGVQVFAISFTIGSFVQVVLLMIFLRKYIALRWSFLMSRILKIVFATAIMGIFVIGVRDYFGLGLLPRFILSMIVGVIVYFALLKFMDMLRYTGVKRIGISFKSLMKK